jgi:hypothetical protein
MRLYRPKRAGQNKIGAGFRTRPYFASLHSAYFTGEKAAGIRILFS